MGNLQDTPSIMKMAVGLESHFTRISNSSAVIFLYLLCFENAYPYNVTCAQMHYLL